MRTDRDDVRDPTPTSPAAGYPISVHDDLMTLTFRLVGEYSELPAGSVMRCVARAVHRALMSSTPREQIPSEVERAARRALAGRLDPEQGGQRPGGADRPA